MPKRHGNLFDKCFSEEALYQAYLIARRGKRSKTSVMEFERNLGDNIHRLHVELMSGEYRPRPYKVFEVHEPKRRIIYAPHFRDMAVQHAAYAVLYPIYDRTFIHDSYGSRVAKGTHKAADQAQRFMRESRPDSSILQLDIRKFFYRICRTVLAKLLAKKVKDKRLLAVMFMFMDYPDKTGIPIGCLLSQLYALIYMNPLDHFIKRILKVKKYVRYVDDFILFDLDRKTAFHFKDRITFWLKVVLKLELSKWTISPVSRGINFVGFRTWRSTRFVRKHSMYTFSKRLKTGCVRSLISIIGNAKRTASYAWFKGRIIRERPDLRLALGV